MTHKFVAGSRQASLFRFRGSIRSAWRDRPAVRRIALLAALGLYAFLSLEPFDWQPPRQQPNHAERLPAGWRLPAPGIIIADPPHPWLEAAQKTVTGSATLALSAFACRVIGRRLERYDAQAASA